MKKIDKRTKTYKNSTKKKVQNLLEKESPWIIQGTLPDNESPAVKYFDKPASSMPQRNKPFSADFNITPDGSLSFNFLFHGFKE